MWTYGLVSKGESPVKPSRNLQCTIHLIRDSRMQVQKQGSYSNGLKDASILGTCRSNFFTSVMLHPLTEILPSPSSSLSHHVSEGKHRK